MQAQAQKLSVREKIGYSLGDTASNLFFQVFISYLPIFYTDVFGLPAAAMGTMFALTRVFDAVNDPVIGSIADRTNSRWGKFRPYLLFAAIPFGIMGVLTFTTPDLSGTGKVIYAYVTYNLLMILYTIVNVPYSALMGVLTPNALERTEVSSYRFVAAFFGGLIVQASVAFLVSYFGKGDAAVGWASAMACLSGLAVLLLWITFGTTKERVQPPREQEKDFWRDLGELFQNKPWLLIAGATIFQLTYIVMRGSTIAYYFKYYVGDRPLAFLGFSIEPTSDALRDAFLLTGTISTIIGSVLTKWFSKLFDKKNTYAGFLIASATLNGVFYVFRPGDVLGMFAINILVSFAFGPVSVLQWAMYTDTADYAEWKSKRRTTGLIMAASLFALKLGLMLGGAMVGWLLSYYGFVANEAQTPEALAGIRYLMTIFPAIIGVIGGCLMFTYPLTNRKMEEIEEELTARRATESE